MGRSNDTCAVQAAAQRLYADDREFAARLDLLNSSLRELNGCIPQLAVVADDTSGDIAGKAGAIKDASAAMAADSNAYDRLKEHVSRGVFEAGQDMRSSYPANVNDRCSHRVGFY